MNTDPLDDLKRKWGYIPPLAHLGAFPLQMISSTLAVYIDKEEPTRPQQIRRSWRERLFTFPWQPWVTHKTIQVPYYKPAIFRIGNQVIYHPSLEGKIRELLGAGRDGAP